MMPDPPRSPGRRATAAALWTVLLCLPWLTILCRGISPISYASEALGYRYFHSYRILNGDPSAIWEAQGQVLGAFHNGLNLLIDRVLLRANPDLRARLDLFSHLTLLANAVLLGGALLLAARSRRVLLGDLCSLGSVAAFGVFAWGGGFLLAHTPDYYVFEITANAWALCLALLYLRGEARALSFRGAALLGLFAAVLISLKITLLPAALLPAAVALSRAPLPPLGAAAGALAAWIAGLLAGVALILCAYYCFDLGRMVRAFELWRRYVSHPGASEPGFWVTWLRSPLGAAAHPWDDHRYFLVALLAWCVAVGFVFLARDNGGNGRVRRLLSSLVVFCVALHFVGLYKRPAGTTVFEVSLYLATSAALLLALPEPGRRSAFARTAFCGVLLAWSLVSACRWYPSGASLRSLRETGEHAWDLHRRLSAAGLPVVVYLPDNSFTSGSVEEALLKGFSDTPSWSVTEGYRLLARFAPDLRFVQQFSAIPPGQMLVWTDMQGRPPLGETSLALGELLRLPGVKVESWAMPGGPVGPATLHALVVPESSNDLWTSVVANRHFRLSTPSDPTAGFSVIGDATCVLYHDGAGRPYVRVAATRPCPLLGITCAVPAGAGFLAARAHVRLDRPRQVAIRMHAGGWDHAEEPFLPGNAWVRLEAEGALPASAPGNASFSIANAGAGDWFEMYEFDLSLARSP
jgi:hypothetical protein